VDQNQERNRSQAGESIHVDIPWHCELVNFLFFGIGTIVAGFIAYDLSDVLIGLGQLFIPFVGWLWSIAWGVLMICDKRSGPIEETTSLL
jgi:hypothetical protein